MAVTLMADFGDPGGVGRHARAFGAALARRTEVVALPVFPPRSPWPDDAPVPPVRRWDPNGLGISLGAFLGLKMPPGRRRILYTVVETTGMPRRLVDDLNRADAVWVPSRFCAEVFRRNGVAEGRLAVVPEGVDAERFCPGAARAPSPRFRFLSVGKWEERKGLSLLVRTYFRTFSGDDPVELVLHAHNPYRGRIDPAAEVARLRRGRNPARIRISPPTDLDGLVALMQSSDAFVLPTRAEGWGLPILEAMACGLPVIVTGYSGHLDYCTPENAYLIDVARMVPARDPGVFDRWSGWGAWAEPDAEHLADLMRAVVADPVAAAAQGARARADACAWSWDAAARIAMGELGLG
ncbi:MAG: glycosyltransferase family 4 protein [Paracoccaceae bacterium]